MMKTISMVSTSVIIQLKLNINHSLQQKTALRSGFFGYKSAFKALSPVPDRPVDSQSQRLQHGEHNYPITYLLQGQRYLLAH